MPYTYDFPRVPIGKVGPGSELSDEQPWPDYDDAVKQVKEREKNDDNKDDKYEEGPSVTGRIATHAAFAGILWSSASTLFLFPYQRYSHFTTQATRVTFSLQATGLGKGSSVDTVPDSWIDLCSGLIRWLEPKVGTKRKLNERYRARYTAQ
ncbi:hypothetical protein FHETE_5803 [Fusarium heterosporum]|uniref:Uncharacterized protein n=1 Tax=Fusarium heterosporum TaxID=42747 RepID=A0A8H5WQC8_FUSHE|nr:hypothetical protein FHETE_5803 [Fusarium heterosporum]